MLVELIDSGTKLLEVVSKLNNKEKEKVKAIATHLEDIAECLHKIEEKLDNDKPITSEQASLKTYTSQLSATLSGLDEQMINNLTETLQHIPDNVSKTDVDKISEARGQLMAWAKIINRIEKKPVTENNVEQSSQGNIEIINRRYFFFLFITGLIGASFFAIFWWSRRKQKQISKLERFRDEAKKMITYPLKLKNKDKE